MIKYHVEKDASDKTGLLVVKVEGGANLSPILSLKDVKYENQHLKIPYSQSIPALKMMAASGQFYFNQKKLICDFYTQVEFYYRIDKGRAEGMLKFLDQEFPLSSCDFLCGGASPWFIKGQVLKLIHTEVSWKDLKQLHIDPAQFSLKNLPDDEETDAPRVVHLDLTLQQFKQARQPFPLLILKDRSGGFADLWMDYGEGKAYALNDEISKNERDLTAEKNWEKDLLETGFIKKLVGQSHYFCPLDQVAKSLTFLLEIGWNIQDYQKKKVVLLTDASFEVSLQAKDIMVRGSLRFDTYETSLQEVAGAFNRRERFVQMGQNTLGLLPDKASSADFSMLFEEGEIVSGGLSFKKHHIGSLETLFQSNRKLKLGDSLSKLKAGLFSLSEMPSALPDQNFHGTLRPYQQQGVDWLHFLQIYGFNGILADDMGLGKTVQVLAFLTQIKNKGPILIVMPTSLIFNWKKEIERFLVDKQVIVHHGPARNQNFSIIKDDVILLTTYTTMRLDLPWLTTFDFSAVILDEAQTIKNAHTQVAQAAYQLRASFRLLVTGTPIENHLNEIWSHFHFLMPELLGDEKNFQAELEAGQSDTRYLQRIKKKIRPFVLRRKKNDVAKDLPECLEQTVWVEMTPDQRQIYDGFLAGVKSNLFTKVKSEGLSKHRLEVFEAILRLRQICCHPLLISSQLSNDTPLDSGKMDALIQDLETALEENTKILVYSQFTSMLKILAKEIQKRQWKYAYLDGSTKDREGIVHQFQEDPETSLFLISLKAGGTGLNLTAADHVLLFDPWWNEAAEKQAINRAHRIGRNKTVFAKRYATVESIEEKMMKLKEQKKFLIDNIFDDESAFSQFTLDDFAFLMS
jgi:SNF2 family DNA or RNA helicase